MKKNVKFTEEYRKFIEGLTINEIKIITLKATVEKKFEPPARILVKDSADFEIINDNAIEVTQIYNIDAKKDNEEKAGLQVEIIYLIKYSIKAPMKKEFFDIFKNTSLRLHTWPYVRQFIHQITFNMNIPPIILGTLAV